MNEIKKIGSALLLMAALSMPGTYAAVEKNWINNKVQAFIKDKPIKAMIYGVWVNGHPISVKAVGHSMTDVRARQRMHFRIGGVTETMLTTILMKLVEEKHLDLSDPVARWYPNLPNAQHVTVKMLANGTSGYPDYVYNKKFLEEAIAHPFKRWSEKELLRYAFIDNDLFEPGTNQRYSHTDYVVLGNILEKAANKSLNQLFQKYIFTPLKMHHSQYDDVTAIIPSPVLHSFSTERKVYEDSTFWNPSWTGSSGSVTSTMRDLGIWAEAWMKGTLLTKKSTEQLRLADTIGKGKNVHHLYFNFGFVTANHWLLQNPNFGGYAGIFAVLPEKKMVFIAFNTVSEDITAATDKNYSMVLWTHLAHELAPEFPAPNELK